MTDQVDFYRSPSGYYDNEFYAKGVFSTAVSSIRLYFAGMQSPVEDRLNYGSPIEVCVVEIEPEGITAGVDGNPGEVTNIDLIKTVSIFSYNAPKIELQSTELTLSLDISKLDDISLEGYTPDTFTLKATFMIESYVPPSSRLILKIPKRNAMIQSISPSTPLVSMGQ